MKIYLLLILWAIIIGVGFFAAAIALSQPTGFEQRFEFWDAAHSSR